MSYVIHLFEILVVGAAALLFEMGQMVGDGILSLEGEMVVAVVWPFEQVQMACAAAMTFERIQMMGNVVRQFEGIQMVGTVVRTFERVQMVGAAAIPFVWALMVSGGVQSFETVG